MNILTENEILSLELNDTLRKHLSRHLVSKNFNNFPGSVFFSEFADSPDTLIEKIKNILILSHKTYLWTHNRCEVTILFDTYIGIDNIISLQKLSQEEKKKTFKATRDPHNGYRLNYICSDRINYTKQLNMILMKIDNNINILTIFPGILAPPIPNPEIHSEKEFNEYDKFWQQHVFIIH